VSARLLTLWCACCLGTALLPQSAGRPPNVVLFLADDVGWGDISAQGPNLGHGSTRVQTPNIDRLAAQGMSFTAAYTLQNCAPARAALLSGQYPPANGVYNVRSLRRSDAEQGSTRIIPPNTPRAIAASAITYAETLARAGYRGAIFGKVDGWGGVDVAEHGFEDDYSCDLSVDVDGERVSPYQALELKGRWRFASPRYRRFARPYDADYIARNLAPVANGNDPSMLAGQPKHLTDAIADAALEFLASAAEDERPFHMWVSFHAIHFERVARPDLAAKYRALLPGADHNEIGYLALTEQLDQSIGRILAELEARGLSDRTLVLFLSDNGAVENGDNGPLRGWKGTLYEGGVRVPMIARLPGRIAPGSVAHEPVHVVDLYPTLAELAGAPLPDPELHPLHGESLVPLLEGRATRLARTAIYWHFPGYMDTRLVPTSVVNMRVGDERYKLFYSYETGEHELYDLSRDLAEETDLLAGDPSEETLEIARALNAELVRWLEEVRPAPMRLRDGGAQVGPPPAP